jgi:hypothetical protein
VVATVRLQADLTRAQEFLLNLPDLPPERLKVEALRKRSERNYSFRGKGDASVAELVITEQGVTGIISVGTTGFGLQPLGDGWSALVRLDREPKHYPNKPEAPKEPGKAKAGSAAADSRAKVNVLVVYTPAAAAWSGDIKALIQLAEDKTNTALANSQVPSVIDIVHSAQVAYTEAADMGDDLRRLTNTSDAFMDEVHALRDTYKADLVALLVDPGNYGGIAWVNSSAAYGFSVTATDAVYYDTFQHELGHNWWMRHNPEEDAASSPVAYAHGYCYKPGRWRTVMSYDMGCSSRINQYSSPDLKYNGIPTGTSAVSVNARVAREKAQYIANFRSGGPELPGGWQHWVGRGGNILSFPECARSGDRIDCWARSSTNSLVWNRSNDGDSWSGWVDLKGSVAGPPACLVRGTRVDCFVSTASTQLPQITHDGSSWGAWALRGSSVQDRPSCVAGAGQAIECFAKGSDKALLRYSFDGSTWKAPTKLTGVSLGSRPDCVARGGGIDCFVVDTKKNLQTARLDGCKWSKWTKLTTSVGLAPQCLSNGSQLDCFTQTVSRQLLKGFFDGSKWTAWINLGGSVNAQPWCNAVAGGSDCYWTTAAADLVQRQYRNGSWGPTLDLNGAVQQRPVCLARDGGPRIDCLARGSDSTLRQITYR